MRRKCWKNCDFRQIFQASLPAQKIIKEENEANIFNIPPRNIPYKHLKYYFLAHPANTDPISIPVPCDLQPHPLRQPPNGSTYVWFIQSSTEPPTTPKIALLIWPKLFFLYEPICSEHRGLNVKIFKRTKSYSKYERGPSLGHREAF